MEQLVDNRYQLMDPIGSGGMADVFLAHDNVLDRDVALKVMNSRYASDDEFVERFRREAQSAAALSHPNIVSIYDRGESDDGTYYIAMEYLSGGTLKDRILKRGALPPKTAAAVAVQIAEALKVAHDRGVVHRDIKPHNILITGSGDIKVTDFGIARAASSSTMTKTGAVMGTAHYISPEQAMGEGVGPASDLYSLGVVLYEMLTGELPFDADTPIGIAMQHVNGAVRPPKEVNAAVPAGLNAIVVKLLQKDPLDRYPSDTELIEDLERVSRGESPTGAATTQVMNRIAPAAASRTQAMPASQRTNQDTNGQRRKKRRLFPIFLFLVVILGILGIGAYNLLGNPPEQETQTPPPAQEFDVPDLVSEGLTLEEAQEQVGDRFEITQGDEQDSPRQQGMILEQDPQSGGQLEEGSEISVTTASGNNAVPDTVESSRDEAQQQLSDAGFEVEVEEVESDEAEAGQVLSQNPGGGSNEAVGSAVTIEVGTGPTMVAVPNIPYGYTQAQSETVLTDAGLTLGSVTTFPNSDVAEGGIIDQDPAPGEEVEEGTAVDIVLSSGPEQVAVPNVIGQTIDDATAALAAQGFGYTPVGVESEEAEGAVLSTDPAGGTEVDEGTIVTVTYSLGPAEEPTTIAPPTNEDNNTDDSDSNDSDSGDRNPNSGNPNSGNPNSGNPNSGNPNSGNPNSGNPNSGNPNIGNPNIENGQIDNPNPNIGNGGNDSGSGQGNNTRNENPRNEGSPRSSGGGIQLPSSSDDGVDDEVDD